MNDGSGLILLLSSQVPMGDEQDEAVSGFHRSIVSVLTLIRLLLQILVPVVRLPPSLLYSLFGYLELVHAP
jgi:hypothetical protein